MSDNWRNMRYVAYSAFNPSSDVSKLPRSRGPSPPTSPLSNASSVLEDTEDHIIDGASFDDEEFAERFQNLGSLQQHDEYIHEDYGGDEFNDGSYIADEAEYYEHDYEDEFGHIVEGADEVQEEARLEEDLEVEDCDFDDDFGGDVNVTVAKHEAVNGRMITSPEATDLRR